MPDWSGPERTGTADLLRIMLLEDSDIDAELLAAHLAKANLRFSIQRVINRREFVTALEGQEFDIVLADYSLPDFDGLSALNIARALRPELPFVFVSGVVGEEFATNALKRGATDYVMKRNLSRLPTAVERALEQARERAARRRTEQALRDSEMSARVAIDAAQLGLWDFDPKSKRLHWDERCKEYFGLPATAEIDYEVFLRGCHPDDRARMDEAVRRATTWVPEQDGVFEDEYRAVAPDGRVRWLATHGQALFEDGACTRFIGVVRDITEQIEAREALRGFAAGLERQVAERTAERDRIWHLSPDLFAVIEPGERFRSVNPAWRSVLGYELDALIGSKFSMLLHPDERPALREIFARLAAGERIDRIADRLRHADGSWRWVSWIAVPDGEAFYLLGRDVTAEKMSGDAVAERNRELAAQIEERERVEDTLRQMQRLEAVGQLTSGVAHDFNNLLTVILGNMTFLERYLEKMNAETRMRERIGHMRAAAERGAKLTAQLLAFSRRQKLEPKSVDLNETVLGMRDMLQSTMGGSIRIETSLKPGLWTALVDPTQIELIILNLAINARDAMEVGGTLTVATANVSLSSPPQRPEEPPPGDYVMLSVSDTGTGMTPEVLAKAFEPFFTTKEVGKGSGLGLAQVYGFAQQSGGGVRIRTSLGQGTSVEVLLPRSAQAARRDDETATAAAEDDHGGQLVLVVDDDEAVRDVTISMLDELGYAVLQVASGAAAIELLRGPRKIDLLLLDYAMPGMSGAQVAREAGILRPRLPILFVTGYADLKALKDVGEERIVRKPYDAQELAKKLALALEAPTGAKIIQLRR